MPFGLCNAPPTYQRIIDLALKDAPQSLLYVIFSSTFEDHISHLKCVLQCYRNANLQLRKDKCRFGYKEIEFLGHTLTGQGYRPLVSNVSRIQRHARPSNVKQLRSFLGLANYYRDFHPELARVAAPLYQLTKKGVTWNWSESCEQSYQQLGQALGQNTVTLAYPDWSKPFHLEVDASDRAIGGVLAQEGPLKSLRPISLFSSTLDEAQKRYSVGEGERKRFEWAFQEVQRGMRVNNRILFRSRRIVTPASMALEVVSCCIPFCFSHKPHKRNKTFQHL